MVTLLLAIIYLAFISLGLPDSLLGSAWPSMYGELQVPISYAGVISVVIALGTVVASLLSDRLTKRVGAGVVTAVSVAMTALALFGFSTSHSFLMLCLWSIPYGLGAGSVDAALNNYVALHYASRHMSWLHCMWGVGTMIGPYIMGHALTSGQGWNMGYRSISVLQLGLTVILVMSLPLWKKRKMTNEETDGQQSSTVCEAGQKESGQSIEKKKGAEKALSLKQILAIRGAKEVLITFFCYCALEQTTILWASSYMVLQCGISAERAASLASLFFTGITVGRAINGFLTMRLSDTFLIRMGQGIILAGIIVMLLPFGVNVTFCGLILIGLGCAPIYPCIIHSTPVYFGADKSQAIIGVQMASAYIGTCLVPYLFGLVVKYISAGLLPAYLFAFLVLMAVMHESLIKKTK